MGEQLATVLRRLGSKPGLAVSEGCFMVYFASLLSGVAWPISSSAFVGNAEIFNRNFQKCNSVIFYKILYR